MSDGGKGSSPRPLSVSQEQFADNWNRIFNTYPLPTKEDIEALENLEECLMDSLII